MSLKTEVGIALWIFEGTVVGISLWRLVGIAFVNWLGIRPPRRPPFEVVVVVSVELSLVVDDELSVVDVMSGTEVGMDVGGSVGGEETALVTALTTLVGIADSTPVRISPKPLLRRLGIWTPDGIGRLGMPGIGGRAPKILAPSIDILTLSVNSSVSFGSLTLYRREKDEWIMTDPYNWNAFHVARRRTRKQNYHGERQSYNTEEKRHNGDPPHLNHFDGFTVSRTSLSQNVVCCFLSSLLILINCLTKPTLHARITGDDRRFRRLAIKHLLWKRERKGSLSKLWGLGSEPATYGPLEKNRSEAAKWLG